MQPQEAIRIIGVTTIRNEDDIIEAFARHNLRYCDQLLIINHGSTDSTLEILQSLQHEGLPITVINDFTMGDFQATRMNRLIQMAARDFAADWIVCLDGDEFIQGPLAEHLGRHHKNGGDHEGQCLRIRLVNYRAHRSDSLDTFNPLERITHYEACELRPATIATSKVILSRALALKDGVSINKGNHQISVCGLAVPFEWIDEISLAHFPLRSPSQYGNKLASHVLQQLFRKERNEMLHDQVNTPYRNLRQSYSAFAEAFYENRPFWVSAVKGEIRLINQPAEYKGGALRYTSAQPDTDQLIRNLLDLAENMATEHSSQTSASAVDSSSASITLSLCDADGNNHVNLQTYSTTTTAFSTLRLSLENQTIKDRIHIGANGGRGLLEIEELVVNYTDGQSRTFSSEELQNLFSVNRNGLKLSHPACLRFAMGMQTIVLTLTGEKVFFRGIPAELIFKARMILDPNRTTLAVVDSIAIRRIHAGFVSSADHRIRYAMGERLAFGDSGDGAHFLRTGWSAPQHWGVWTKGNFSTLFLRLGRPATGNLSLKIQIRRRQKGIPLRVSINIDQERVLTTVLETDSGQWLTIPIPANRSGRWDLDLAFQIEGADEINGEYGFGIKFLQLEETSAFSQIQKKFSTVYRNAAERLSGIFSKNHVALSQEIEFHRKGCPPSILGHGWAPPTDTGCLMEERCANLELRLPQSRDEALILKLFIRACQENGSEDAILTLGIKGRQIARWELPASTSGWLEAVIPPSEFSTKLLSMQLRRNSGNFELTKLTIQKQ